MKLSVYLWQSAACVCVSTCLIVFLWSSLSLTLSLCQCAVCSELVHLPNLRDLFSLSPSSLFLKEMCNSVDCSCPSFLINCLHYLSALFKSFSRLLSDWIHSVCASTVRVPDAGLYMVGLAVFPSHKHLHRAPSAPSSTPQPPSGGIEVRRSLMLFI